VGGRACVCLTINLSECVWSVFTTYKGIVHQPIKHY